MINVNIKIKNCTTIELCLMSNINHIHIIIYFKTNSLTNNILTSFSAIETDFLACLKDVNLCDSVDMMLDF